MPRIRLAHWHGGHAPGSEIDVSDDELVALRRDGRVAAVLPAEEGGVLEPTTAVAVNDTSEPEPVEAPPAESDPAPEDGDGEQPKGRRRR